QPAADDPKPEKSMPGGEPEMSDDKPEMSDPDVEMKDAEPMKEKSADDKMIPEKPKMKVE
ncbi:MAG: hypothetical protein WCO86_14855, partial [Planctomycetota bacterium]